MCNTLFIHLSISSKILGHYLCDKPMINSVNSYILPLLQSGAPLSDHLHSILVLQAKI